MTGTLASRIPGADHLQSSRLSSSLLLKSIAEALFQKWRLCCVALVRIMAFGNIDTDVDILCKGQDYF